MKIWISLLMIGGILTAGQVLAQETEGRPEYQKEYESYLRDLDILAQTGKAPENPDLEADLRKMNSDEKILLTAPDKEARRRLFFAQSSAEIVDSVEIIRVPKEFRRQYKDVYKEEKKEISTQSVAEEQQNIKKKILIDESAMKVAGHQNPFRFLKEVPLSPLRGEYGTKELPLNPMVDAYFNQFGRPYSEEPPSSAPEKIDKGETDSEDQAVSRSLGLKDSMFVE